jgi:hypothetical protein
MTFAFQTVDNIICKIILVEVKNKKKFATYSSLFLYSFIILLERIIFVKNTFNWDLGLFVSLVATHFLILKLSIFISTAKILEIRTFFLRGCLIYIPPSFF